MPRKNNAGAFEGHPAYRWTKMVKGVRWRVLCRGLREGEQPNTNTGYLGLPESWWTKDKSMTAANDWWDEKLEELAGSKPHAADYAKAIEDRRNMLEAIRLDAIDDDPLAERLRAEIQTVEAEGEKKIPRLLAEIGIFPPVNSMRAGEAIRWLDRIDAVKKHNEWNGVPDDPDKTLGSAFAKYLERERAALRQRSGSSPASWDNIRRNVKKFVFHLGGETVPANIITATKWDEWVIALSGKTEWSKAHIRDVLVSSRKFVEFLWQTNRIDELPRTLREAKIDVADPETIKTLTNDEILCLIAEATGQTKLHLLLMLNIGATQKDISDLTKAQVDIKAGTITRKRSKTRGKRTVPTVTYPLWKTTLAELKKHWSDHPTLALTTRGGMSWQETAINAETGKLEKRDGIVSNFRHLRKRCDIDTTLKVFRSTSGDRIGQSKEYRELRSLFLGHSNKLMADRRYGNAPNELLAEAVTWLGEQYGMSSKLPPRKKAAV
jgi:integrase